MDTPKGASVSVIEEDGLTDTGALAKPRQPQHPPVSMSRSSNPSELQRPRRIQPPRPSDPLPLSPSEQPADVVRERQHHEQYHHHQTDHRQAFAQSNRDRFPDDRLGQEHHQLATIEHRHG